MEMSATFLIGLTPEERKQALLKISQFILRKPSGEVRDSIYKKLLEIGIYLLERKEKVEVENILDVIEEELFGVRLDEKIAKEYLNELMEENLIDYINGKYVLDRERRSEIADYSTVTLDLVYRTEDKFIKEVSDKYGKTIIEEDEQNIVDSFYQFIISLVSKYVINTARLLVKGVLARISTSTGKDVVRFSTQIISDDELRKIVDEILIQWMLSPDDDFIEYLYHMRQNFLCMEVLNLDPECRILEREMFSEKRLLLDTNILFPLTMPIYKTHMHTKRFIDNTLKLGCSLYITNRTIEEFNHILNNGIKEYETRMSLDDEETKPRNIFIRNYEIVKSEDSHISWEEYITNFQNIEDLGKEFGFNIYERNYDNIKELIGYDKTIRIVQQCWNIHRGRIKREDIAEHDAFHLLLVKTLREEEDSSFLGPNTWFLTLDFTLTCVDRFINRTFNFSDVTSASMNGYLWDEIISPFLTGIVEEKELVEVFKAFIISDFTPISGGIRSEVLIELDIDWSEFDWLEFEEIEEILSQQFALDYLQRQEELTEIGDRDAFAELRAEFNVSLASIVGRISSRKISQMQTELEEIKERERGLLTETNNLMSIIQQYSGVLEKLKLPISALTWIAAFLYFYGSVLLPTMEATSAAIISITISTIIGYLIGFPGYKWLLEKLLSFKPTSFPA